MAEGVCGRGCLCSGLPPIRENNKETGHGYSHPEQLSKAHYWVVSSAARLHILKVHCVPQECQTPRHQTVGTLGLKP